MTNRRPYRRWRYIIDPSFQGRFVGLFVVFTALGMLLSLLLMGYLGLQRVEALRWRAHTPAEAAVAGEGLLLVGLLALGVSLVLVFLVGRYAIRSVAGPLYRMRKDLLRAAEGELGVQLRLRKTDEFQDTATELARAVQSVGDRLRHARHCYMNMKDLLGGIRAGASETLLALKCEQLLHHLEELELAFKEVQHAEPPGKTSD